ncbi:MAG: ribonuclease III [Verrucomicrobiales bacterium]|nr:ribonuclease III [Verrucomicrobiales bacterium]|tara:strand:- start:1911 stop:2654 length:744 start_codon:yes stop_codon:yes gene_type:complete
MPRLGPFQKRIGYTFRKPELLSLALTHPSVGHEKGEAVANNQRLEFLGDAVLQLTISAALYREFPGRDEGALSKARARLVNREGLAARARAIRLGTQLILSRGEEKSGGRDRDSALADAFEALVGAIYLDGGFTKVRKFVHAQFEKVLHGVDAGQFVGNPKGELQEMMQSKSHVSPDYKLLDTTGPDHDREFVCAVHHEGRELARGKGKSKKLAEADAAAAAICVLKKPARKKRSRKKTATRSAGSH